MEWTEQAEIPTEFGEGEWIRAFYAKLADDCLGGCNLLIATRVVEEGLDVQVRSSP